MKENFRTLLFCFMTALYWFSQYSYVPILSPYAESLGAPYWLLGMILGSYGLMQMIIRLPLGVWSDTLRKRKVFIIAGIIISIISSFGMWYFANLPALFIFRALSGVSAATWVAFTVLFSSYYVGQQAPKAMGILNAVNYTGQMIAMFLGGLVAQSFGSEYAFALGSIGGIGALILSFGIVEKVVDDSVAPIRLKVLLETIRDRNLLIVSFLAVLSQILTYATVLGFTPLAAKAIGANSFELGILTALATLPAVFASPLSGTVFTEWFGERNTVVIGFAMFALYCLSIPYIKNIELFYLSQFIGGFGRGLSFSLLMGLSIKNIPFDKRATAMGFFQAVYGLGMFLGPVLVGLFGAGIGLSFSFLAIGAIGVLAALISRFYIQPANE
jgi:MFS family permease